MAFQPLEAKGPIRKESPGRLEKALEKIVIFGNTEGIHWLRNVAKRPVREIPKKRAKALSAKLASMEPRDPEFFWEAYFPMVWTESVFSNLVNDQDLEPRKWSAGYCGLQVDTARSYAEEFRYEMPRGLSEGRRWLVNHWEANLEIGYAYLKDLWKGVQATPWDESHGLKSMSAYRTGLTGALGGRQAVSDWMKLVRRRSLAIQKKLGGTR